MRTAPILQRRLPLSLPATYSHEHPFTHRYACGLVDPLPRNHSVRTMAAHHFSSELHQGASLAPVETGGDRLASHLLMK